MVPCPKAANYWFAGSRIFRGLSSSRTLRRLSSLRVIRVPQSGYKAVTRCQGCLFKPTDNPKDLEPFLCPAEKCMQINKSAQLTAKLAIHLNGHRKNAEQTCPRSFGAVARCLAFCIISYNFSSCKSAQLVDTHHPLLPK